MERLLAHTMHGGMESIFVELSMNSRYPSVAYHHNKILTLNL